MRIKVKEIFRGVHNWPKAGETIETEKVGFLANEHAHDFRITVECNVTHEDREIEFYLLRNTLREIVDNAWSKIDHFIDFGSDSCETIGKVVLKNLRSHYGSKGWVVEVAENEFQSGIIYEVNQDQEEKDQVVDVTDDEYDRVLKGQVYLQRKTK